MKWIKNSLAAPVFPGNEWKTNHARLIGISLLVQIVLASLIFLSNLLGGQMHLRVLFIDGLFFAAGVFLFVWLRLGKVELVGISGIALNLALLTVGLVSLGTIRDPSAAVYIPVIIMAGYLFGLPGAIVTTVVSSVAVIGVGVAETWGLLGPADYTVTATQWLVYSFIFAFSGYLVLTSIDSTQNALRRADNELGERLVAEDALRFSERKFRSIIEQSLDGILMIDGSGRITIWNRAMYELMGKKADDMVGQLVWDVDLPLLPAGQVAAADYQQLLQKISMFGEAGQRAIAKTIVQEEVTLANGVKKHIEYSVFSIEVHDQFWIGCTLRDITDRARLEARVSESEKRWQFALEGLGEGVWDYDYVNNRVYLSPQWAAMLGYDQTELGQDGGVFMHLVHPDDYERIEAENQLISNGKLPEFEREVRLRCKNGIYRWILTRGKIMEWTADGRPARGIGRHRDITEEKQIQAELRNREQNLLAMQERERLAREIHDGLGQALGYLTVQAQATVVQIQKQQYEVAQANLQRMAQLANETLNDLRNYILDLRLPAAQPVSFQQTLETLLDKFTEECGILTRLSYPVDMPGQVFAPAVEEQVLRIAKEALVNIRKHAEAHYIQVIVSATPETVQLIIADDGRGFSTATLLADASATYHFGLSIMRERAEQIGGRIEVRTAQGKGTQVILFVPNLMVEKGGCNENVGLEDLRVLLVDDHPLFLEGLHNLLSARGVTVVGTAENGLQALDQARALHPSAIVMDVQMPEMNGVQATKLIKTELPEIKIVMLTVSESEDDLYEALRNGASGYLLKSLEANEFCQYLLDVVNGESPLPPNLASRLVAEFGVPDIRIPTRRTDRQLSPQQWQILNLVAEGLIYKQVAQRLSLSEKTIKYHMGQIIEHLHLETREQAIAYVRRVNQAR